jgi:cellulose synthase/poly-beta-1,6-N-acetylglucosamine synthase-like glycosyltransferase
VFWHYYDYIALLMVASQLLFLLQTYRNYRYAIKKSARKHTGCQPCTLLTIPCKGVDNAFEENITSFLNLDYENYYICFVVADAADPAYEKLCRLKDELAPASKALDVRVIVAGHATGCSQKIHNLLHSCTNAPEDVEVFAFADSDACLRPDWLSHLVYPLRKSKHGASTGYRWFVPSRNNLASLALSSINAKIAQLLGDTVFNQAWGGSMAIRAETFRRIKLDEIWQGAISDDLSLSYAVKKAYMKIIFVPACLVASYEKTTWLKLFEFARRQFLITRVTTPGTWWFGFLSSVYSLAGLWVGAALAIYAVSAGKDHLLLYAAVPIAFLIGQICRSILRQKMITRLLPGDAHKMKPAIVADILGNCIWSWILFGCIAASAFGRTITWRGIRYKLIGPTETIIINPKTPAISH